MSRFEAGADYLRSAITLAILVAATFFPVSAQSKNSIPAKAAVIMDASGSVIFAKYPNARLAPASTVKLMTAMIVLDKLDPSSEVRVSANAASIRSIHPRIHPEETMLVSDLLHLTLMKSINSAAVALAETAAGSEPSFVKLMNKRAKEMGAKNTLFANASGLPTSGPQYSTASDLVLIMREALSYPLIREILGKRAWVITTGEGREIWFDNSNDLLWQREDMIGGKTGYTGNARHCFVCAIETEKGTVYTAVLGARSRTSLWTSTLMLAEIGENPEQASFFEQPQVRTVSRKTGRSRTRLTTSH